MKKLIFAALFIFMASAAQAQSKFSKQELSVNGFRNPSIGLEYRYKHLSVHGGYYITNFTENTTTQFIKAGVTYWFLPVDKKEIPSSFYTGISYLRGINRDYDGKNAVAAEAGFRWMIWKGLNLRMGIIALAAKGEDVKFNPTPGLSYSIKL